MAKNISQSDRLTETIAVKVTAAERARIEAAAGRERLSAFGRRLILEALPALERGFEDGAGARETEVQP